MVILFIFETVLSNKPQNATIQISSAIKATYEEFQTISQDDSFTLVTKLQPHVRCFACIGDVIFSKIVALPARYKNALELVA